MIKKRFFLLLGIMTLLLAGCGSNGSNTDISNETSEIKDESKEIDIVGDWYGVAEVHSEYNDGLFEAVLSINSDGRWASCVNGDVNQGTWEIVTESKKRIALTVEYEGSGVTNTWSFEKKADGKFYYDYVFLETIPIEMTKMEKESKNQMLGDWQGATAYTYKSGEEKQFAASLSINADNSWSSSVSGDNNAGKWSYISESSHLVVLIVEYDGTDATNTWALVKNADDEYYYEYVYMENISIPVVKL